jgi:hypothetical protein
MGGLLLMKPESMATDLAVVRKTKPGWTASVYECVVVQ